MSHDAGDSDTFGAGIFDDRKAPARKPDPKPEEAPAAPLIPDLSAWGKTAPPPPPVTDEFVPGDDIGNRIDGPEPSRGGRDRGRGRGRGGDRRGGERRGGDRRRFFGGRGGERHEPRPYIPGPPPPPTDLPGNPRVIARQDHPISRKLLDANALQVLYRLHRAGHRAFLVGGALRDLLLGERPKDFDVVTDAQPRDVKRLFGNAFIIGRRFRLCHVRFGGQVVEVSTFRAKGEPVALGGDKPDHGQAPLDENVFGTPEQDALRRDLTINALFYDIGTFTLIDYVGGMEDLQAKRIRVIGDAVERFREDPVRMVRVARFAARLGFSIEEGTRAAIGECGGTLASANPSRMLEEWYKLLNRGAARGALELLQETGLLGIILPGVAAELADPARRKAALAWLGALDGFDVALRPLPNALALAGLFGARIEAAVRSVPEGEDPARAVWEAIEPDLKRLQVSRRDRNILLRMVLSQPHFAGAPDREFAARDTFPPDLDFFELRGRALGLDLASLPEWRRLEAEVPRRPLSRIVPSPLPGEPAELDQAEAAAAEAGASGPDGQPQEGGRGRRRRRGRGRGRRSGDQPRAMEAGAGAARTGHDLEAGPPPGLYPQDDDEKDGPPGWMDDDQPPPGV